MGRGSSLCLGVRAVGRQKPSPVSKARQRLEGSQGSRARCAAGARPHGGSHPQAVPGKLYFCFSAVGKFLLLPLIYWKVAALLAGVPGGAKRKTNGNSSADERQAQRGSWDQRHSAVSQATLALFCFSFESFLDTHLRDFSEACKFSKEKYLGGLSFQRRIMPYCFVRFL